jgi:hypothetical protein
VLRATIAKLEFSTMTEGTARLAAHFEVGYGWEPEYSERYPRLTAAMIFVGSGAPGKGLEAVVSLGDIALLRWPRRISIELLNQFRVLRRNMGENTMRIRSWLGVDLDLNQRAIGNVGTK